MKIHSDFIGGNIVVERIENDTVYLERDLRDTEGDWFYWSFCAEGFAGRTMRFVFPSKIRVGRFGAAVSHEQYEWFWSNSGSEDSFTYTFAQDEDKVFFCHDIYYHPLRFDYTCSVNGLAPEVFCNSVKGRDIPFIRFGYGDKWIVLTSRHHACESTGTYVLEGVLRILFKSLPDDYSVLAVPFVDFDGVVDGDQGKNRRPYDHNRDYTDEPIYEVTQKLMEFSRTHEVEYFFDFHSPWHTSGEHDHIYVSHSTEAMKPKLEKFLAMLKAETSENTLKYTGEWDVGPNEKWNRENSPNSKNWFSKLPTIRLASTLETTYFGLEDGRVSVNAMIELGQSFGKCVVRYIEYNK